MGGWERKISWSITWSVSLIQTPAYTGRAWCYDTPYSQTGCRLIGRPRSLRSAPALMLGQRSARTMPFARRCVRTMSLGRCSGCEHPCRYDVRLTRGRVRIGWWATFAEHALDHAFESSRQEPPGSSTCSSFSYTYGEEGGAGSNRSCSRSA